MQFNAPYGCNLDAFCNYIRVNLINSFRRIYRMLYLSPALCEFLNVPEGTKMLGKDVIQHILSYIIENKLHVDNREIGYFDCDEKLARIFGDQEVRKQRVGLLFNHEFDDLDVKRMMEYHISLHVTQHFSREPF